MNVSVAEVFEQDYLAPGRKYEQPLGQHQIVRALEEINNMLSALGREVQRQHCVDHDNDGGSLLISYPNGKNDMTDLVGQVFDSLEDLERDLLDSQEIKPSDLPPVI